MLLTTVAVEVFRNGTTLSFHVVFCGGLRQRYGLVVDTASLRVDGFVIPPGSSLLLESQRPANAGTFDDVYTLTTTADLVSEESDATPAVAGQPRLLRMAYPVSETVTVPGGGRNQPAHMVDAFTDAVRARAGGEEAVDRWAAEAVATQRIVDLLFQSVSEGRIILPGKSDP